MDLVKNMAPRNIGPGGMSGRVTSIDVVNSNPDIMFVGTASRVLSLLHLDDNQYLIIQK